MYFAPDISLSTALSLYVIGVLEFVIAYFYFNNFFVRKEVRGILPLLIIMGFAAVSTGVNLLRQPVVNTASVLMLDYLLGAILFEGKWKAKLKFGVICTAMSIISEIGASFILPVLAAYLPEYADAFALPFAVALLSKLIFGFVVGLLVLFFPKRYSLAQAPGAIWVLVFPILGASNMHLLLYMNMGGAQSLTLPLFLLGAMMLISTMAPLVIYDVNLKRRQLESELRLLAEREQASEVFYLAQERSLDDMRRQNHDFKNHLINLRELYGRGTPEAEAYYASLVENLEANRDPCPINIGNKVVSNIISRVRGHCGRNGIRFTLSIDCGSLAFLRLIDASAIFDNAFDNALTACMAVTNPEERFISLSIIEHKFYVSIHVTNSMCGPVRERNGRLESTKEEVGRHGYGLENIRISAQKYGGDISYEYTEKEFSLWVRLGKLQDSSERL